MSRRAFRPIAFVLVFLFHAIFIAIAGTLKLIAFACDWVSDLISAGWAAYCDWHLRFIKGR